MHTHGYRSWSAALDTAADPPSESIEQELARLRRRVQDVAARQSLPPPEVVHEELLTGLVERRDQLDELIDVLQQQESSRLALSAMSLEEQAAQCLEEGCPIDTVETLVNELETAARTLSGQGKSHRYVDELISLLSTSQGMPVSKPPLSSLSAPFVVSPAKVLS